MTLPSVAVAIPAYNEADGIGGFLREIDEWLSPATSRLALVLVDDASSDGTATVVRELALGAEVEVIENERNLGHGPTLLRAYRRCLELGVDHVLAVDGDGQFHGRDLRRIVALLQDEAHAVCGVRRFRQDPRFRMAMTRLLRGYVRVAFGVGARDPNCPLRGYDSVRLAGLLGAIPQPCMVPNLFLTIVASRRGVPLLEVDVSHSVRRGDSAQGSAWRSAARRRGPLIPWRLIRFSLLALRESAAFRAALARPVPLRSPE